MSITAETLVDFLVTTPFFRSLEPAELTEIAAILQVVEVPEGYQVFEEGDEGDAWYLVYEGELLVSKQMARGPTHDLARLERGDCFGEMALLDDGPRGASVSALTESILLRFPRKAFEALLDQDRISAYKLIRAMSRVLSERHREITQVLADIVDDPVGRAEPFKDSVVSLLWTPPSWE